MNFFRFQEWFESVINGTFKHIIYFILIFITLYDNTFVKLLINLWSLKNSIDDVSNDFLILN